MKVSTVRHIVALLAMLLPASVVHSQQARVYYQGTYFNGPFVDLNEGQTINKITDGDELSIDIIDKSVGVKITAYEKLAGTIYVPVHYLIYTESDFPEVFGTDQWENCKIKIECLPKATSWQSLPQPALYVPFDSSNANPNPDNDAHLHALTAGHRMLVLDRAFMWENSEDIDGFHGPYGDVKIGVYDTIVMNYPELSLFRNNDLWAPHFLKGSELPGPIWSAYAPALYPDPYDEWVDGSFGCVYSNISVYDWGKNPSSNARVSIIVFEADSPDSYMGRCQRTIGPLDDGELLVKVWGFGFVVLKNIWVPESGKVSSVDNSYVYWYGGWNKYYSDQVPINELYGPTNSLSPVETSFGSQFKPFADADFLAVERADKLLGRSVGLLGGKYPATILSKSATYKAIDGPVTFGK